MKTETKQRILAYLMNGGTEEEKQSLVKVMEDELRYADLDSMRVCNGDIGCSRLDMDTLHKVAETLQDRLMQDFNAELGNTLEGMGLGTE